MTIDAFTHLALTFDTATEQPHFEKKSYRINKKIFATLDEIHARACIKLDEVSQSVFSSTAPSAIYPVSNKWGKQGWTIVELKNVKKSLVTEMLQIAVALVGSKSKPPAR